jgi:hypothetical protein
MKERRTLAAAEAAAKKKHTQGRKAKGPTPREQLAEIFRQLRNDPEYHRVIERNRQLRAELAGDGDDSPERMLLELRKETGYTVDELYEFAPTGQLMEFVGAAIRKRNAERSQTVRPRQSNGDPAAKRKPGKRPETRSEQELALARMWLQLWSEFQDGAAAGDKRYEIAGARRGSYEAFLHWLDFTKKVDEDALEDWRHQGGRNVTKEAKRALGLTAKAEAKHCNR